MPVAIFSGSIINTNHYFEMQVKEHIHCQMPHYSNQIVNLFEGMLFLFREF